MEELIKEIDALKERQKILLKEKNLNVQELNKINLRMLEIREEFKKRKIKEKERKGLYIY